MVEKEIENIFFYLVRSFILSIFQSGFNLGMAGGMPGMPNMGAILNNPAMMQMVC